MLTIILTLSFRYPFSTTDPDSNPNSNPNSFPNPNSAGLANLFVFGPENGKNALRFKEHSEYREVQLPDSSYVHRLWDMPECKQDTDFLFVKC